MQSSYSTNKIHSLAKKAIKKLENGEKDEFFRIINELLKNKPKFYYLYLFGAEIGKVGLEEPERYFEVIDELFKKGVDFGCDPKHFKPNKPDSKWKWTDEKIKALVFGSRISIITSVLSIMGEKYPNKVIPIIREYLVEGDGWYICDGLSIAMGNILKSHFNNTLPVLIAWAKDENRWLRRAAVVSVRELMKKPGHLVKDALIIFNLLMKDDDKLVKKGMSWMLREMTKHYEDELIELIDNWKPYHNKHTIRIIKEGIKKLPEDEQKRILTFFNDVVS